MYIAPTRLQLLSNRKGNRYIRTAIFKSSRLETHYRGTIKKIEDNFDKANSAHNIGSTYYKSLGKIWGRPSFVPEQCINLAGKEVSRAEALFFAVPYHIEKGSIAPFTDQHQLCANYIERKVKVIKRPHKYRSIIVPSGLWQQVQTIESVTEYFDIKGNFNLRYNNKNCIGFRPNNHFLPYNRWFIKTRKALNK